MNHHTLEDRLLLNNTIERRFVELGYSGNLDAQAALGSTSSSIQGYYGVTSRYREVSHVRYSSGQLFRGALLRDSTPRIL